MNGDKNMKKTHGTSKTLAVILTYAMVFQPILNTSNVYAQDPYGSSNVVSNSGGGGGGSALDLPSCDTNGLVKGDLCVNEKNQISKFIKRTVRTGILGTGIGKREKIRYVSTPLSSKELSALFNVNRGGNNGSGNVRGNGPSGDWACNANGGCRGGTRNEYYDDGDDNGNVGPRRGGGGGGGGYSRGNRRASSPQDDFDDLNDFCGNLPDMITDRQNKIDDLNAQIAAFNISDLQKAEADARAKMQSGCRRDCLKLAMAKDGACKLDPDKIAEVVSKEDLNDKLLGVDVYFGGQSRFTDYINGVASVDPIKACQKILAKKECLDQVMKTGLADCEASKDWIAALNALEDGKKQLAQLKANLDTMSRNTTDKSCRVTSAVDVRRPHWNSCGTRCLEKALDSCPDALADAKLAIRNSPRDGYCPTCGQGGGGGGANGGGQGDGGGGVCIYGNCNNGGVSKAAQIISAIGGIGVPLGLGFMNMSMQNRALNACISTYAQQVEVAKTVGLPPQASQCGLAYGMGGMGMGMGGMGLGGMGMGGLGMGMGMGGMYPGMGLSAGLGIGMGMGSMYPGMGMGMGGMYPSMYPSMGMGMGGMYNPMMGMYGNAMGSMQGNMMGVQQQMYNAQLQMQQMAAQNMVLQNSMYSGGGLGMMGSMGMSPYYGMGSMGMGMGYGYNPYSMYSSGYNPYSSGFGLNISAGLNLGTGYNPYSMYGTGMYNPYSMGMYNPYSMYGGSQYPSAYYLGQ